jgi:3alpha(or 20beta)-hydroxysteroid dehydrogenase
MRKIVDVNLLGPTLGMQRMAPLMAARGGGSIVNISSSAGMRGAWGPGAYTLSKWGLRGVTKAAAAEYGPLGVRVNSVHPGMIDISMLPVPGDDPSHFQQVPLAQVGLPTEVAELVLFLSSDASS